MLVGNGLKLSSRESPFWAMCVGMVPVPSTAFVCEMATVWVMALSMIVVEVTSSDGA